MSSQRKGLAALAAGTSALSGWKVEFDLPSGSTPGSYWDALLASSGNHHSFTNRDYNGIWSAGRDNGGCPGGGISPTCSSISQSTYEFTNIFKGFNG